MIKRGYCSIIVANYDGTWLIRFISKSYIHSQKDFTNKLYLVLHAYIHLFVKKIHDVNQTWPQRLPRLSSRLPDSAMDGPIKLLMAID